jgi:hypothetical protein
VYLRRCIYAGVNVHLYMHRLYIVEGANSLITSAPQDSCGRYVMEEPMRDGVRFALIVPLALATCGRSAEPPAPVLPAKAWLFYEPSGLYADSTFGALIGYDDGSGEHVLTRRDFAAQPFPSNNIKVETRTSGTLRVRAQVLGPAGDTLATLEKEFRLAPDTMWEVHAMPGAVFPQGPTVPQGPPFRPLPGSYVTVPIRAVGSGALTRDSLFLIWLPRSLSEVWTY